MYIYTYIHIYLFLEKENLLVAFIFTERLNRTRSYTPSLHCIGKKKSMGTFYQMLNTVFLMVIIHDIKNETCFALKELIFY